MLGDELEVEDTNDGERFSSSDGLRRAGGGSGRPLLPRSLTDVTVKVGTRTRFLIEVNSLTPITVRWEKDGKTVEESDRIKLATEGQFYCLDISPVYVEDSGIWSVWVKNSVGVTRSSGELSLLIPKAYKKPEFVESLRAALTSQGTVSLECKVIGVPTPTLRWFKGNSEIKAGDILALTANASDPTSLGTYTCLASNCMGTAESTSIVHLDSTGKTSQGFLPSGPKPIFTKELRNEKVKLGGTLTLDCTVSVPPWPEKIHWYGPSGEVVEGDRFHIMEDGAGMYSITLNDVIAEDNGTWKCVATNKDGATSISSAVVAVSYPKNYRKPKFLESLKAILTEEGLVSFECKVVGYPTPHLSWLKDGNELRPGDVYQLTGTNSLGSYCCIAKNCMGQAESSAELTLEDIKSQLSEEERLQLSSEKLPPRFLQGMKSTEAKISESLKFTVQASVFPEPTILWFRDEELIEDGEKYKIEKDRLGVYHLTINRLEFADQAEWKCVATNDYGQSVTSCFLKLNIPRHYKKPKFLEDLKAVMSDEGAVNLECKVIGVPQPKLKWFKDGKELKAGDIHKIISGQDGTCCLGTYTCLAQNCMGTVSSSASLLGFEEKGEKSTGVLEGAKGGQILSRDRSLSTIHEERTSQLHDTDKSTTIDDRAEEVSFSFDGKEVSVSLYETPDLTEEEALQVVEMYADQISEHVSEHNLVELPPMRFTKESSTSGKLLMEAVVIDVSPDYFVSAPTFPRGGGEDDLRTDADVDEFSLVEDAGLANLTPDEVVDADKIISDFIERTPVKPPRKKHNKERNKEQANDQESKRVAVSPDTQIPKKKKLSVESEKEDDSLQEFERRKVMESQRSRIERKRTESELEDDSLYEFENRKTKEEFKSISEDKVRVYSPETGVAHTPTSENGSAITGMKSLEAASPKRSLTEDEATFDTAEDSAFEKSETSVLESLAHSLHEIHKGLAEVEAQVASESTTEMHSARGLIESLIQPLTDVQRTLEVVEARMDSTGQCSSEMIETLVQPITKFQRNLALIDEIKIPSLFDSVSKPLENLNREIAMIQKAAQIHQQEYEKSVDEVQEALSKIIERQSSVPGDKGLVGSLTAELHQLEEKANDDLEKYYDRLLSVGTELRQKANEEEDQEVIDILRSVGDLVKPLKKLTAVTSKCIAVIVEDNEHGIIPTKKVVESLLKPLDALDASLGLLENVASLRSHRAIRGAGIPVLYNISVPMDELETTMKLVENLSAHTAVEFLIPPLENLAKIVCQMDVSEGGKGFLENLPEEGEPILKNLEDSLDVMLNCISSIEKGVPVDESERDIAGKLPAITKPMDELQKSLKLVEKVMKSNDLSYEDVYSIAQDLSKPLQAIRSEFSILQHEIEADHYSTDQPADKNPLFNLIEPLESVQNCISSFHETVMCKSSDDPMHLRFIMYALKQMGEPFNNLCSKIIKTEEVMLGRGDPYHGLKAVARSVSELRESSVAVSHSESNVIEKISSILSEPLTRVQNGLEDVINLVDQKTKESVDVNIVKNTIKPFKELQTALLEIEEHMNEGVTEGVTPELKAAVQELHQSILSMQESSSSGFAEETASIESNIATLQSLTQPLQTLRAQFSEIQRSNNRNVIKADRALTLLRDYTRRVCATITELETKRASSQPVVSILHHLGLAVEDLGAEVENAATALDSNKKIDEARLVLADVLKTTADKLGEMCSEADDLAVSLEPSKRKSLVLVQDVIHDLQIAFEQSQQMLVSNKELASDRNHETLLSIELLTNSMSAFHTQLNSVEEFALTCTGSQGIESLKDHVDQLESILSQRLLVQIQENNDRLILESISNDIKSVQRVTDNLAQEGTADTARVRFILAKIESVHEDLKDMSKNHESSDDFKTACQTAISILNIGEGLVSIKETPKLKMVTNIPDTSVIGDLLENIEELESDFKKMKQKGKFSAVSDRCIAEMSLELSILQGTIQDLATEASGELLDKAQELCIPIKAIEEHLKQVPRVTQLDIEEASESLHDINRVLTAAIKKKEVEKLAKPLTSVIGDLLESVDELELGFNKLKKRAKQTTSVPSENLVKLENEITILQGIVEDLATEATGELLDKAHIVCSPVKEIEEQLMVASQSSSVDLDKLYESLHNVNCELQAAIKQNEIEKNIKVKEFEHLFSYEALTSEVDIPIIKSIITTVGYMHTHLSTASTSPKKAKLKQFLEGFESNLIHFGESLINKGQEAAMVDALDEMEAFIVNFDIQCMELDCLYHAVEDLKNALKPGEMRKVLPGFQSVLSPLKALHEDLSRTASPILQKEAESKYLEWFSKASTELELGLMKLEKAILTKTKIETECMANPIEHLATFIDSINKDPQFEELDDECSLAPLKTLAQPIFEIQEAVCKIQDAVNSNNNAKAMETLFEISKPVRELRANIALIQDQAMINSSLNQLGELKQAVSLMANQASEESTTLKRPLLRLQARLQEFSPDSELEEVVSEITGPVDSLKQAVEVLESRGESSILLELCHQVVNIISRADDTLSEMSSIEQGVQETPKLVQDNLLSTAKISHIVDNDQALSDLSSPEQSTYAQENEMPPLNVAQVKSEASLEQPKESKSEQIQIGKELAALRQKIDTVQQLKLEKGMIAGLKASTMKGELSVMEKEKDYSKPNAEIKQDQENQKEVMNVQEESKHKPKTKEEITLKIIEEGDEEKEKQVKEGKTLTEEETRKESLDKENKKFKQKEEEKKLEDKTELGRKKTKKDDNLIEEEGEKKVKETELKKQNETKEERKLREMGELETKGKSKLDRKEKAEEDQQAKGKDIKEKQKKEEIKEEETAMKTKEEIERQRKEEDLKLREEQENQAKEKAKTQKGKNGEEGGLARATPQSEKKNLEEEKSKSEEEEKQAEEKARIEIEKKELEEGLTKEKEEKAEKKQAEEKEKLDREKNDEMKKSAKEKAEMEKKNKEGEKKEEEEKQAKEKARIEKLSMNEEERLVKEKAELTKKKKGGDKKKEGEEEEEKQVKEKARLEKEIQEQQEKSVKEEKQKQKKEEEEKQAKQKAGIEKEKKEEEDKLAMEKGGLEKKKRDEEKKKKEEEEKQIEERAETKKREEKERLAKEKDELEKMKQEEEKQAKEKARIEKEKKEQEEKLVKEKEEKEKKKKEEEKKQKEEEEKQAKEKARIEKEKKEQEEKLAKEKEKIEEKQKEKDKKKKEEEEKQAKDKAEKEKMDEEERLAKENAEFEKEKKEQEEKLAKENVKKQKEEEEKRAKEKAEKEKKDEEERLAKQKAELEKKKQEEEQKKNEEEEKKAKEKGRIEKEKKEEEEKLVKEKEKKVKEEEKKQKEEEEKQAKEKARIEKEKKEQEEKLVKEKEEKEKKKNEEEIKQKEEEEKQTKEKTRIEKEKKEQEEKLQKEKEEKDKMKKEEEKKQKEEEEKHANEKARIEKEKKDHEEKLAKEKEEEEKIKKEEEEKQAKEMVRIEKEKKEQEEKLAKEKEEEEKIKKEEEEKQAKEKARIEKEKKEPEEKLAREKEEIAKKKKEEEKKQKDEEEKQAKEKSRIEKERKELEEKLAKEKEEKEKMKKEEEKKQKEEEEKQAKEKSRIEKERKEQEEKLAKEKEEKEKKKKEEEKKQKEEEEKQAKEKARIEKEKKEQEEKSAKEKEEIAKKKKEEEQKKKEEEQMQKEEEEKQAKEKARIEKEKKEQEEKSAKEKEEIAKKKKEEEQKKKEEEQMQKEEEEKQAKEKSRIEKERKEQEEKLAKEKVEKEKRKKEEEKKQKEEEEKQAKEKARIEKEKKEQEEKLAKEKEEIAKKKKEEEQKEKEEEKKQAKEKARIEKEKKEQEEKLSKEKEEIATKKKEEEQKQKEEEEKQAKEKARIEKEKMEQEEKLAKEKEEIAKKKKEKEKKQKEEEEKQAQEKARIEKERKEQEEKLAKEKEEKEKKKEQEEKKQKEEEEKQAKEKARIEKERKEQEEKFAKEKEEIEKLKKEEEKKQKEEEEKKAKEKARIEKEKKEQEEKLAKEKEEIAKKKKEEEKKQKDEEEKQAKEKSRIEKERKEQEEKLAKEKEEIMKKKKEEEKKQKEEEEKQTKEKARIEKEKKEKEEKLAKEKEEMKKEEEKKQKEEEENKAKEKAKIEKEKKEQEEKLAKEKEEIEKKKKEEEKKQKEEEEKQAKEKARIEKERKEQEEKLAKEKEEKEKKKKEEEKKQKEEEEQLAKEKARIDKEKNEEERRAKEKAETERKEMDKEKKLKDDEENQSKKKANKEKKKKEEEAKKEKGTDGTQKKKNAESDKQVKLQKDQKDEEDKPSKENMREEKYIKGKDEKQAKENNRTDMQSEIETKKTEDVAKTKKKIPDNEKIPIIAEEEKSENAKSKVNKIRTGSEEQRNEKEETVKMSENGIQTEVTNSKISNLQAEARLCEHFSEEFKASDDQQLRSMKSDGYSDGKSIVIEKSSNRNDRGFERGIRNQYSANVVTTSSTNTRGIEVIELMDYQPSAPVRPERGRRVHDVRKETYADFKSREDKLYAYQWDKSKQQSWDHLEYPAMDYESPSSYHRTKQGLIAKKEFASSPLIDSIRYQPPPKTQRSRRSISPVAENISSPVLSYGSTVSLTSRRHMDELTAARLRPPTPTRSLTSLRSRSITRIDQLEKRAYICNGLLDKTVVHGGKIRLTCNIGGDPDPTIEWLKDGKPISLHTEAWRYKTQFSYGVASLEVSDAMASDSGQYSCIVKNTNGQQTTTSTVRVAMKNHDESKEWSSSSSLDAFDLDIPRDICLSIKGADIGMPRVTGLIADPVVPSGGTIALHVQVSGCKRPDISWLRGNTLLPKYSPRVHYFEDGGIYTLLLEGATPAESGVYTCRVSNERRGAVDTTTVVKVVERREHEKPALFTVKPDTRMSLTTGEDMTLTCYVSGEPRPQVSLMKGIKDITTSCRTLKESFGEYVRLTLKRITSDDRGTFFIVAKNIYGSDRAFVTLQIRDRARSLTPTSWSESRESLSSIFRETHYHSSAYRSATPLSLSKLSLYE